MQKYEKKQCRRCYATYDKATMFNSNLPGFRAHVCRKCLANEGYASYNKDKDVTTKRPFHFKRRNQRLASKYGVPIQILEKDIAKGCGICGADLNVFSASGKRRNMVVDHCHKTGEYRGVLCYNCNHTIGMAKDDPNFIRACLHYLETRGWHECD